MAKFLFLIVELWLVHVECNISTQHRYLLLHVRVHHWVARFKLRFQVERGRQIVVSLELAHEGLRNTFWKINSELVLALSDLGRATVREGHDR